jgi:hypothetical protein
MRVIAIAAALCAAGVLVPLRSHAQATPAAATTPKAPGEEFTGFGKATFGMRWEAVKKLFPDAEEIPDGKDLGAASVGGPFVHRLLLKDQKVEGLAKPAKVELRFWKKKLWGVVVYFNDNEPQAVLAYLTKRLGPSQNTDPDNPIWFFDKTQTTASVSQKWYGTNDTALSKKAQAWFALLMTGQWTGATQADLDEVEDRTPGSATPAATAPAATPAAH